MNQKSHKSIYKHYPGSNQVILFIHGILEGPKQFRHLAQIAYEMGYSTQILLLPGHGVKGRIFARTSYEQWVLYVSQQIKHIKKQYEEVLIVGHSMGALLALCEIATWNHQIIGAILIDPPIKVHLWPRVIEGVFKIRARAIKSWDHYTQAQYHALSVHEITFLDYLGGVMRYLELFVLIRYTKKQIHKIQKPLLLIFAKKDEFVSLKSRKFFENVDSVRQELILEDSGHFCYHHTDLVKLEEAFKVFLKELNKLY